MSEYYIAAWEKMQADRHKPPQFCSKNPAANLLRGLLYLRSALFKGFQVRRSFMMLFRPQATAIPRTVPRITCIPIQRTA